MKNQKLLNYQKNFGKLEKDYKMKNKTNKRKKMSAEEREKWKVEQAIKRKKRKFKNKIRGVFTTAGFTYFNTENKDVKIGLRVVELDSVFIYENIIVVCEDTGTASSRIKDHARNKNEAFGEIKNNVNQFLEWLKESFEEKRELLERYESYQYNLKFLYFSQEELELSSDDYRLFPNIMFVEPKSLNYLHEMAQCIKKSVRYEVFRFLNITNEEIGNNTTEVTQKKIKATIISPKTSTGLKNGVRIVSFMMSADTLIRNSYVMRKDNWEDSVYLYQRLIKKEKIRNIRKFLVSKEEAFYNNIIVALPDDVLFFDDMHTQIDLSQISGYDVCTMLIPDRMNSICVIDGQHRIFAHYEGMENDIDETKISKLRAELHLLVTGLVFPREMSKLERAKIESEIFLDINSNAKPVPQDVLLHIRMVKDPLSDVGLARMIIEQLNKESIFLKKFEMSSLDDGKIKIASVIKFALRYLVTIEPKDRKSLYSYWNGDKQALETMDDVILNFYIEYCVKNLVLFFSAVRKNFIKQWNDPESKILSVTSINGFIIAYNKIIDMEGVRDFDYFDEHLKKLEVDFSKEMFPYTSSQYGKFSEYIVETAFKD